MDDEIEIKLRASTRKVGSESWTTIKIDRESWEYMSEQEREEFCLEELLQSHIVEWTYEVEDDSDL